MNYRHAFHAGNFADVLKHAVLACILVHLREKPSAFRVIDTHAGGGIYDLTGDEASRSREWQNGIQRLLDASLAENIRALLAPYLDAVAAVNPARDLAIYPGSPAIVRILMRAQDRLTACELEATAVAALKDLLARDRRCKAVAIDGWVALNAYVPPPERRGLVLIDPPYEREDEFTHLAPALIAAHRKWATGIYLLWYPIKRRAEPDALARRLRGAGIPKILRTELTVAAHGASDKLTGCGLIAINPPWRLAGELKLLLPALAALLSDKGGYYLDWIAEEA
jgi:23S rRNA (adenine2030-N6)-methyltransferase